MTLLLYQILPQINALARYTAMKLARVGDIPWTAELVQEHNRDWLRQIVPHALALHPTAIEDGVCACQALCLIVTADEHGVYHRCTVCGAAYLVRWEFYEGRSVAAGRP